MTKEGNAVWEWRVWEHLDPAEFPITAPQNEQSEWTHGDAVSELPDRNLLVSFRHISTIMKINRESGTIVWKLGSPTMCGQHAPVLLKNGNILIFDNGAHRVDQMFPFSRVIEVNPATNEIVWKFRRRFHLTSSAIVFLTRTAAQRKHSDQRRDLWPVLRGHSERRVVWEYVNPYFGPHLPRERSKTVCFGSTGIPRKRSQRPEWRKSRQNGASQRQTG